MMKKLLGYFFVLTMFTLIVSCEEEEFTDIQTSSSSNKAIDFGSHSENAVSDFQTDSDRPLSHVYYGDYVEKRNEYGVSYTYGIISVNPKDYASGPKDYYENMVVVITNDGKENGFVMRYDSKTDKPISWIPVYGTVLSFPCGYVQITSNVPCSCAGHAPGDPTCTCETQGYTISYPQGIPCGAVFTDGDDVSDPVGYNVGGSKGLGGSGSTNPSGMGSATHIPGNHYPESIAEVPFAQVPEVKVIDEETEMKIAAIESFTNTQDQAVNDWLTRNHSSPLIDELFDVFTSSFTLDGNTSSAIQIINEVLTFVTENNSQEAEDFALGLMELTREDVEVDIQAFSFILSAKSNDNELDSSFLSSVEHLMDIDVANSNLPPEYFAMEFSVRIAVLRAMHPEWSDLKVCWEASKEFVHITLDVFGLVPVVGEVADLTNGVLYTIEGDGINATLSYASAIPIVGYGSVATKYGLKIMNNVTGQATKLVWKITANGVEFGSRSQLRKVLGLLPGNPNQAHHIIPWSLGSKDVVQKAAHSTFAFHMNDIMNGIEVAAWRNQPNHNLYNDHVEALFDALPNNLTPDQAFEQINIIVTNIRNTIINNPNTHLNDLVF